MKELKGRSSCVSAGLWRSVEKLFQGNMKGQDKFSLDSLYMVQASNNLNATEQLLSHLIMWRLMPLKYAIGLFHDNYDNV